MGTVEPEALLWQPDRTRERLEGDTEREREGGMEPQGNNTAGYVGVSGEGLFPVAAGLPAPSF